MLLRNNKGINMIQYKKSIASRLGALATGAFALVALSGTAHSALLGGSITPNEHIDGETYISTINIAGGSTITGLSVTVDFTKCDDPLISSTCSGGTNPFNNELMMKLEHGSTIIDLIEFYTFSVSNSGPGQRSEITFDDGAADLVGTTNGGVPEDGTFQPVGSLASFIGDTAAGDWNLVVIDGFDQDPTWLTSWSIAITTLDPEPEPEPEIEHEPTAVSEPGTLAILGLGLAGLSLVRRRKNA